MSKPRFNIVAGDGAEGICQGLHQGLKGAGLRRPESCLDLRPTQLNRVEIRRVGRQEFQAGASSFNERPDVCSLVSRQVVHEDNIASPQARDQDLFDVNLKGHSVHGSPQDPGGLNVAPAQGGHQRVMRPRIAGRPFHHAQAGDRPSKQAGQAQIHPAFIDEFQVRDQRVEFLGDSFGERLAQPLDPRRLSLAIMERLFFAADSNVVTRDTSYSDWP